MARPALTAIGAPCRIDAIGVLQRLAAVGPPSALFERAPIEAAAATGLDRVLLSVVRGGALHATALRVVGAEEDEAGLLAGAQAAPVAIGYPLIEAEVLRRREAQVVPARSAALTAFADAFVWRGHVAAPVIGDGRPVALLQGDRRDGGAELAEAAVRLGEFALCLGLVLERAVLRRRLRAQELELRDMAAWLEGLTRSVEDDPVDPPPARPEPRGDTGELREVLTRREYGVLRLLARGASNAEIAEELVVSPGTVKFHVKNILRKLGAANRSEATARYVRATLTTPRE